MVPERFAPVLAELAPLAERFADAGHRLYLVGGAVRDLLVGTQRSVYDLDLTTDARPPEVKRLLAGWGDADLDAGRALRHDRRPAHVAGRHPRTIEITTFRAEAYADDSRKPHVTFADDIESDLARRDFTVNAMALELRAGDPAAVALVDPFGGAADLATATLRTPLGPEVSFDDDPLRMLRAARFIAALDLQPVPELRRPPSPSGATACRSCRPSGSATSSTS